MKNNETGEFELVLGNRQLLSGFFVVALLFGVAFAMGYIVGRNSAPSPKLQAETAAGGTVAAVPDARTPPVGSPVPSEAAAPPAKAATETEEPAPADSTDSSAPSQPAVTTQPARESPVATPPALVKTPAASEAAPADTASQEPVAGTYWQVTAIQPPQAEILAKVLRDKGFHVSLTPGTKGLMRVLIGPYPDREALGRAKSDLESAGFHPVILKKE
jgi:cell division septation protein DedD